MTLVDTHCHLGDPKFDPDRGDILKRAFQADVTRILIPAVNRETCQSVLSLSATHPSLYAALGIHPTQAGEWTGDSSSQLRELIVSSRESSGTGSGSVHTAVRTGQVEVVAIGEIGLDYYWNSASPAVQNLVLEEQLHLASELALPVVIHCREKGDAVDGPCAGELLNILEKWIVNLRASRHPLASRPGVLHSFSGSQATASRAMELNFYIGVTGPVTWRQDRQDLIRNLPLERLLLETDAPWLAPAPLRGRRNEPANVSLIADKIAALHASTPKMVAETTSTNAKILFGW